MSSKFKASVALYPNTMRCLTFVNCVLQFRSASSRRSCNLDTFYILQSSQNLGDSCIQFNRLTISFAVEFVRNQSKEYASALLIEYLINAILTPSKWSSDMSIYP